MPPVLLGALAAPVISAGANAVLGGGKSNFQAGQAPIMNAVNNNDILDSRDRVKNDISQQQAFVQALQAQNGIGNQSQVYNQLQGVANGTGPNPAQAMLANATGANNAATASLMAGQRGASQNPALIARQAAQQGAANQQTAIGQGAALQAQQSLGAIGQAGNLATQQVGQQAQGLANLNQFGQNYYGQNLGAVANQNAANVSAMNAANNVNAGVAATNQATQNSVMGGLGNAVGTGITAFSNAPGAPAKQDFSNANGIGGFAHGGEVHHGIEYLKGCTAMARGGKVPAMVSPGERYLPPKAAEAVAKGHKSPMKAGERIPGKAKVSGDSLKNDTVKKNLEAGGVVIPRSVMQSKDPAKEAARFVKAHLGLKGAK